MKAVLVTGATTPLGRAMVEELLATSDVARVLALGIEEHPSPWLPSNPRLRYERVDLTSPRAIRDLLFGLALDLGVDCIVHSALHRSAWDDGERIHALNVESTREILHLAEHHPTIRRVVFRSFADVYKVRPNEPCVIDEEYPLELSPAAPQWIRDRVEADLLVCARMGVSRSGIMVLRTAECLVRESGSQLWDYLRSWVCLRPLGFDPMMNLISSRDLARAVALAVVSDAEGIINVPGKDTLPLSALIRFWNHHVVPVPDFLLSPLYRLRAQVEHGDFRYHANQWRFHYGTILDGKRAEEVIGYVPRFGLEWPRRLVDRPQPMMRTEGMAP
jgi:UDP-glucose 4-epimerase